MRSLIVVIVACVAAVSSQSCSSPQGIKAAFGNYLNCIKNTLDADYAKYEAELRTDNRRAAKTCFASSIGEGNARDVCVLAESDLDQKAWDRNGPLRDCSICRTFAVGAIKAIMNTSSEDQKCIRAEVSKAVAREADYCIKQKIPNFVGVPEIPDLEEKSYEHREDVINSLSDYILIQSRLAFCAFRKPERSAKTRACLKRPFPGYLQGHCQALSKCDSEIESGCGNAIGQAKTATCQCVEDTRSDLKRKIAGIADAITSAVEGNARGLAIGSGSKVDTCVASIKGKMITPANDWVEVIDSALSKCIKNKAAVGGENLKKLGMDTLLNVGCRKVIADQTGTATTQLKAGFDFINNLIDAMVDRSGRFCGGSHCSN